MFSTLSFTVIYFGFSVVFQWSPFACFEKKKTTFRKEEMKGRRNVFVNPIPSFTVYSFFIVFQLNGAYFAIKFVKEK